jgi:hypothetical protein
MFVAAWIAYFWGDGDRERAACLTAVELFAGPLLAGAVLAVRGRRWGLRLLRFGSLLCLPFTITAQTGPVTGLAFRADSRMLASCSDNEIATLAGGNRRRSGPAETAVGRRRKSPRRIQVIITE